jgi:hypothetical protein
VGTCPGRAFPVLNIVLWLIYTKPCAILLPNRQAYLERIKIRRISKLQQRLHPTQTSLLLIVMQELLTRPGPRLICFTTSITTKTHCGVRSGSGPQKEFHRNATGCCNILAHPIMSRRCTPELSPWWIQGPRCKPDPELIFSAGRARFRHACHEILPQSHVVTELLWPLPGHYLCS